MENLHKFSLIRRWLDWSQTTLKVHISYQYYNVKGLYKILVCYLTKVLSCYGFFMGSLLYTKIANVYKSSRLHQILNPKTLPNMSPKTTFKLWYKTARIGMYYCCYKTITRCWITHLIKEWFRKVLSATRLL